MLHSLLWNRQRMLLFLLMNENILFIRRLLSGGSTLDYYVVICVILSCNLIAFIV